MIRKIYIPFHFLVLLAILLLISCGAPTPQQAATDPSPTAAAVRPVLYVLLENGQSNDVGADKDDAPAGLPDASIWFWRHDYHYKGDTRSFGPLDVAADGGTFSHEIRIAQRFKETGLGVAVIKIAQGGTFINRWIPSAPAPAAGSQLYSEVTQAVGLLRAAHPDTELRFLWVWDQGESEARYFDRDTVEHWSDDFTEIHAGMEAAVGEPLSPFVVRTCSTIAGKTFPGLLEAEQASVTTPSRLIDSNDSEFRADHVHRLGRSQNRIGDRIADVALSEVP